MAQFFLIVSSHANIRNTFFDQQSPRHPEVGVWAYAHRRGGVHPKCFQTKNRHIFDLFCCLCRPILPKLSLNRSVHDNRKCVFGLTRVEGGRSILIVFEEKNTSTFFKIVLSQANIRNKFFDQRSP